MIWKRYGCALPFMLVWCGGTGAGIFFASRTIVQHLDAQINFRPVEATIESTEVVRSGRSGRKLRVTFTYEAAGATRRAVGPTFDHPGASFAERDPAKYPQGMKTTAWVDPRRPHRAILDRKIPADVVWSMIFFQPFLAVSIGGLVSLARAPSASRREREFFRQDGVYPWTVPEWGMLEERGRLLTIHRPPETMMTAGIAWGLSTFVGTFLSGMVAAGFEWDIRSVVPPTLALCAIVTAGFATRSRRRGGHTVTIDREARQVRIVDHRGERLIPWEAILEIRESYAWRPRRTGSSGARLWIRRKDGTDETLNEFDGCDEPRAVAARIGRHLAGVTGRPFESAD